MVAALWRREGPLDEAMLALKVLITHRKQFFPPQAIGKRGIGVMKHSHSEVHYAYISPSYNQHSSYDLYHRCRLSNIQRCLTYRPRTAHAHARQQCSVVTDTLGISACGHWLGEGLILLKNSC